MTRYEELRKKEKDRVESIKRDMVAKIDSVFCKKQHGCDDCPLKDAGKNLHCKTGFGGYSNSYEDRLGDKDIEEHYRYAFLNGKKSVDVTQFVQDERNIKALICAFANDKAKTAKVIKMWEKYKEQIIGGADNE